jgi:hypothetical protein
MMFSAINLHFIIFCWWIFPLKILKHPSMDAFPHIFPLRALASKASDTPLADPKATLTQARKSWGQWGLHGISWGKNTRIREQEQAKTLFL